MPLIGVEESPRSREEGGGDGGRGRIPSLGYSGKEEVTFLLVRIIGWQAQWRSGWGWAVLGVLRGHSLLSSHSQLLGMG